MKEVESKCYGVIPVVFEKKDWKVLLVQHHKGGFWSFPKGHSEEGEQPLDSAKRELQEEVGLQLQELLCEEPFFEQYQYVENEVLFHKTVYYFLGKVQGRVSIQEEEIADFAWCSFSEAEKLLTYPEGKKLLVQAVQYTQAN